MNNQKILDNVPEGATHFSWDGYYLKYDLNRVLEIYHVNYKHWQQASTWIGVDRSLADIKRIAGLETAEKRLQEQFENIANKIFKRSI
jgi:hypothetical protein